MKDIRLYIADMLVDLDSESIITMNYQLGDTDNPTIVKNSFSKSISLPATEQNNALFGGIYDLTRISILSANTLSGAYFNTLKRTPFKLFANGDLVESGYIQLTSITKTNGIPRYTIQAYGGLGDFLYNLMYNEEGDKRTLASLKFGLYGYTGDSANEMDFNITRDVISNAWSALPRSTRNTFTEALTFVPAYNGVSSDFDGSKAVVNYNGNSAMGLPNEISDDNGNKYARLDGYGLVEFKRALDETETRDMRSYLQRPALSVRSLFEACANPDNNGGYAVNLDPSFFTEDNPLYHDAYITLPMMSAEVEHEESATAISIATPSDAYVGGEAKNFIKTISMGNVSLAGVPNNAMVNVNVPLSLTIHRNDIPKLFTDLDVYEYSESANSQDGNYGRYVLRQSYQSAIVAQLLVTDAKSGALLGASPEVALSTSGKFGRTWKVYTPYDGVNRGVVNVKGNFELRDGVMQFVSSTDNNTFPLSATITKGATAGVAITLRLQRVYKGVYDNLSIDASILFRNGNYYEGLLDVPITDLYVGRNIIKAYAEGSEAVVSTANLPSIASGSKVTKDILLGKTESPADYLLSYIKLFNLRIIKDVATKTIDITQHYFTGEVVNIHERIDRGQAMTITPNVFNKKFMRLGLSQSETYFSKKYKESHKLEYGQKRVDTGFLFNTDTEEIYNGNIFTSAVPCLAVSKFYNTFKNSSGNAVFAPFADDVTLTLASGNDANGYKTFSKEIASATIIDPAKTTPFSVNKGYDVMPRMCYFDEQNGEREMVDISNNLVVFCRNVALADSGGNAVTYWLTDDVVAMTKLNDRPCYLLTNSTTDVSGNDIAKAYNRLPLFLSVQLMEKGVINSFDFAKSKETYIPNINYPEGVTLYERYWSSLYSDRMDVDTRKVTCMVNLSGIKVDGALLRRFFFFDGNYWVLNKVEDYDPTTDRPTKCEFIKVKNRTAYYTPSDEQQTISEVE